MCSSQTGRKLSRAPSFLHENISKHSYTSRKKRGQTHVGRSSHASQHKWDTTKHPDNPYETLQEPLVNLIPTSRRMKHSPQSRLIRRILSSKDPELIRPNPFHVHPDPKEEQRCCAFGQRACTCRAGGRTRLHKGMGYIRAERSAIACGEDSNSWLKTITCLNWLNGEANLRGRLPGG